MTGRLPVFNIERFAIHDGEGIRTAVFLQGCTLRCPWCANPESHGVGPKLMALEKKCLGCGTCQRVCRHGAAALADGRVRIDRSKCVRCGACAAACPGGALSVSGQWMTPEEIFDVVRRDADYYRFTGGGLTLSGGEALLHIEALEPLLRACADEDIGVDFETCGHVPPEHIDRAIPWTRCFLFDIKSADAEKFHRLTGGDLSLVLGNLGRIDPERVVARVPVIPGLNHTREEMEAIFREAAARRIRRVDLLPYHTLGLTKYRQLGIEYPWDVTEPLHRADLEDYPPIGRAMGLTVTIAGK